MGGKTVTRVDLCEAIYQRLNLSRTESAHLLEMVLDEIGDCIVRGEAVKFSSFGSFKVRTKGQRVGRNPKTGESVLIPPRRGLAFKPSDVLKQRTASGGCRTGDQESARKINARFRPGSRSGAEKNFQKYGALDPENQVNSES